MSLPTPTRTVCRMRCQQLAGSANDVAVGERCWEGRRVQVSNSRRVMAMDDSIEWRWSRWSRTASGQIEAQEPRVPRREREGERERRRGRWTTQKLPLATAPGRFVSTRASRSQSPHSARRRAANQDRRDWGEGG